MQAHFRGYKTRKVELQKKNIRQQQNHAAISVQTRFRGHQARQNVTQRKEKMNVLRAKNAETATMLQARTRGYLIRKKTKSQKRAATVLQSRFRGHYARAHPKPPPPRTRTTSKQEPTELKPSPPPKLSVQIPSNNNTINSARNLNGPDVDNSSNNNQPERPQELQRLELQRLEPQRLEPQRLEPQRLEPQRLASQRLASQQVGSTSNMTTNVTRVAIPTSPREHERHSSRKKRKKKKRKKKKKIKFGFDPLRSNKPLVTPNNTLLFRSTAPIAATSTIITVNTAGGTSMLPQTTSLQRSLIGGLGLDTNPRFVGKFNSRRGRRARNNNATPGLFSSDELPAIDWAEVRLTKHLYSERESLDALYRPLAVPRLLKPSFDDVVKRIRVMWNQLRYPIAQRGSVIKKMSSVTKENYMLLVSHMLLLQAAHRHLVSIVNKIRKDVGEDPIGVGTGSHLTPKRPIMSPASSSLSSPRRGLRTQKRRKGGRGGRGSSNRGGSSGSSPRRNEGRNDQWSIELSTAISQLKGLTPWVQEFVYRGDTYV